MAWTTPQTWTAGSLVDAADLNAYLYANMIELAAIVYQQQFDYRASTNLTTTSTSNVLVGANYTKAIDIKNNRALIIGAGQFYTTTATVIISLYVNSVFHSELARTVHTTTNLGNVLPLLAVVTGLTPGTNQFDLYWRVSSAATATLCKDGSPAMFHVREC